MFPELRDIPFDRVWSGMEAVTPTQLPYVGRYSQRLKHHGLWLAHGYNGFGMAMSVMAGATLAEAITGSDGQKCIFERIPRWEPQSGAMKMPAFALLSTFRAVRDAFGC